MIPKKEDIAVETTPDALDATQNAADRNLLIRNIDQLAAEMREVRAALRRIDDDEFGKCLDCNDAIHPKRLAVVPWARLCVTCQDREKRAPPTTPTRRRSKHLPKEETNRY